MEEEAAEEEAAASPAEDINFNRMLCHFFDRASVFLEMFYENGSSFLVNTTKKVFTGIDGRCG